MRSPWHHRPFELRKAPDHLHEHASGGCGRVNGFRETAKAGPGLREALHNMEQILERAGEAVEFPDDHHIVGPELIEQPMQLRPIPPPPPGLPRAPPAHACPPPGGPLPPAPTRLP